MLVIEAPEDFRHAGYLRAYQSDHDPRRQDFKFEKVVVDLRRCQFIRPAAVLWCLVYPLLLRNRGAECELWVPDNRGVSNYVKSVGLFNMLQDAGVDIDDRGLQSQSHAQLILPLTAFTSRHQAEQTASTVSDRLVETGLVAANLVPEISEAFAELANNAAEHSKSDVGSYGLVQFCDFGAGRSVVCAVGDGGIGIRASLMQNPEYQHRFPYDWVAIEHATKERISGTGNPTRGIGLFGVATEMRHPGRRLIIHSGIGSLVADEESEAQASRVSLFPGTAALTSVPC